MDLFGKLRQMPGVKKISNLYLDSNPVDFLFFICPNMSGFKINKTMTGFMANYSDKPSKSVPERVELISNFLGEFAELGINYSCKAIFANADPLIICPRGALKIPKPPEIEFKVISNFEYMLRNIQDFWQLLAKKPWLKIPEKIRKAESKRLDAFLPNYSQENLVQDFKERIWAGFALDGILIRQGDFGQNPVILGVESETVPFFQNAGLPKTKWLPVIQLI